MLRSSISANAVNITIEISRHQQEHEIFELSVQEHPLAGTPQLWQQCSRHSGCSSEREMLKTLVDTLHPNKAKLHKITCAESVCGQIQVFADIASNETSAGIKHMMETPSCNHNCIKKIYIYINTHGWHCQMDLMILEAGHIGFGM